MQLVFQKKCKNTDIVRYVCLKCKKTYSGKIRFCSACGSPFIIKLRLNLKNNIA